MGAMQTVLWTAVAVSTTQTRLYRTDKCCSLAHVVRSIRGTARVRISASLSLASPLCRSHNRPHLLLVSSSSIFPSSILLSHGFCCPHNACPASRSSCSVRQTFSITRSPRLFTAGIWGKSNSILLQINNVFNSFYIGIFDPPHRCTTVSISFSKANHIKAVTSPNSHSFTCSQSKCALM